MPCAPLALTRLKRQTGGRGVEASGGVPPDPGGKYAAAALIPGGGAVSSGADGRPQVATGTRCHEIDTRHGEANSLLRGLVRRAEAAFRRRVAR